jgi:hypothetical protein
MKISSIEDWLEQRHSPALFCNAEEEGDGDGTGGGKGDGDEGGDDNLDRSGGLMGDGTPPKEGDDGGKDEHEYKFGEETIKVPDAFWDKDKSEVNVGAALKSALDSRKELTKLQNEIKTIKETGEPGEIPEKPEDYLSDDILHEGQIQTPEGVKNLEAIKSDDPGLTEFLKVAHEAKLTPKQFETIVKGTMLIADGMTAPPFDEKAEGEKFGKNYKAVGMANVAWVDGLVKSGEMSAAEAAHVKAMGRDAVGLSVVNKMRMLAGGKPLPTGEGTGVAGELPSKAEWYKSRPDPHKEPAKYEQWQEQGKELFGTAPSGSSESGLGV